MFVCIHVRIYLVLIRSLHVSLHRFWISLLIEFGSKAIQPNTTKNKFFRYLCFITVDFIHSCHQCRKMISFSLEKNRFRSIDLTCWRSTCLTTAFTILNVLNMSSWKDFWSKDDSSHCENSPSFQISWT